MAAKPRDSENRIQKQLQEVVLRAAVGRSIPPIKSAISLYLSEGKRKPKEILDTFPEDLGVKVQKKYHCHSPLMIACEDDCEDIVDVLLKNEATIALKNRHGLTAVHIVCRRGNLNVLKKLLEKAKNQQVYCSKKGKLSLPSDCEAVLLTRAKEGWYPVMYAVKEGHIEIVKECFDLVDHAITTKKKQTVLHIAARAEQLDCLKEIVPKVSDDLKTAIDKNGWNVFHHACASGNPEVLRWLIDKMKDVCSDMLKQKCKCNHTPLSMACEYRKEEIVRYLLTLPDVDVATNTMTTEPTDHDSEARERTPLHIAAAHNSTSIVELLIEKKHSLTTRDKNGDTALHYAYRSESMDVINLLEQHRPEIKSIMNDSKELPNKVEHKDVIPLEISRRGVEAIEIYKRVLKKGRKKIPRCNLLILGEERVGKTSLYRLLVRKDFDQDLQPTRGIDDNEVDIIDERSITMGDHDEWKEKLEENKEEQINKMYIDSVSDSLHAELPTSEQDKKEVYRPDPVLSEDELMNKIEDIKRQLERIHKELTQERVPSQYQAVHEVYRAPLHRQRYLSVVPPQGEHQVQLHHPKPIASTKRHQDKPKSEDTTPRVHKNSENSHVYFESEEVSMSTPDSPPEETKQETSTPNISRRESQIFNKKLKAKKKEAKDKVTEPIQLELRALDFAGQKQYRPMHHCFITRRAMYLVVFNLQTMIEYIEAEESIASGAIGSGDAIPSSPIEQLRYWLYSIHAHIFPPNEDDNIRRVCLVGTHKFPQGKRKISEDDIKKIDERLKREFKRDERCINMFHYMGPPKTKQIFTCVENSIDGKECEDRERSGALCLQKELKLVSNQLKFLDEDHPLIWLRFEHRLIKMRQNLIQKKRPLFVTVDEVLKLAENQGIDDAESQKLALNFFHDTGKLVYLERVPTLYLSKEEQKELAELIILDPVWLTRVMRAVMELNSDNYSGDRIPAMTLVDDGIASEDLLKNLWAEFLGGTDDRDQAFHHLCTILKAYCLIYPLKKNAIPNLEDRAEEPPSPGDSSSHSESERQPAVVNQDFLIPCMLPENVKRKEDSHLNWITFFFDFQKFLPEVLYHRFLCQLLADCHTSPQCCKGWSRFNRIHGCNWKIEPMRDVHRLKISVLSKDMTNLSQHIIYIHKNYLRRICAESEFIGLKYHGGPAAKCRCKEKDRKVLQCVSFCMEKKGSDEPKLILDCEHCLASQDVEQLLQPLMSSSEDEKAQKVVDDKSDNSNEPPELSQAFRILMGISGHWRNIGVLLKLDNGILGKINVNCRGTPDDCLRDMLDLWLKQVSPQPTRKALAEAVEIYDPALAKQIMN